MKVHEFTIIASGLHPDADDVANIFFDAGCDDAVLSFQKGVLILEFEREAVSSAVISALTEVARTGARIERLEPDHLVSLADVAKRTGLTRGALTHYHKGDRGEDFPTPVARVTSDSPLWDWFEVATWLFGRSRIGRDAVVEARIVREANLAIETHALQPDQFISRLTERVLELEDN